MKLGPILKKARKKRGLSHVQLGKAVRCSPSYISRIELGRKTHAPSIELLEKFARVLELPFDELCAAAGRIPPDVERWILGGRIGAVRELMAARAAA